MSDDRTPATQPQRKDDRIDEAQEGTAKPDRGKPDQGGEAELTEKEEQKRGGANKSTPGPIYDV
ncbi:hypothetical protein D9623_16660 [Azospirillum brasilense]|uniref:Uncharacterized protein n=1 Tax=Azospirillum brasilense TaxID=192 RepID=A0A0P0F9Q3_AZOBR|nr:MULTISPECIES: hypothetical protein [Azospirillum]ALJ36831.1 hypothetical protein AMK58_14995 [Azospirillum brasilense]MDW7555869.1 hypothetical protein [Azospirillum brasilense]MDW7595946.1 hypothetical protein [Azospirillum brasilense]MDW7630951.1 hypothetical protein [Azospirillum brasilense]MDX5951557.1 hypothetical protein [Azospirillum brasilense]